MRVAIVGQNYPPLVNGQATFTRDLAEGLAGLGHEVLVACPSPALHDATATSPGLRVERLAGLPLTWERPRVPMAIRPGARLRSLMDAFGPDVVHLQDHYPLCRAALGDALRRGVPIVATNHFLPRNFTAYAPLPEPARAVVEAALWRSTWPVFRRATMVTAPTETALGLLREHGVHTPGCAISCGVDLRRFRPPTTLERTEARQAFGLAPETTVVLYVGRLEPEKRLDVLLRAMHTLRRPDLELVVAGRGVREGALARLRDELGLGARVRLIGYVPGSRLAALFGAADVFVMPSEAELQSIATLQALASGLPVVAADAMALPEIVRPGVDGELFRPGDAADLARRLDTLAGDAPLRRRMGEAGRALAEAHDQRRTVERYAALYEEVIVGSSARPAGSVPA